MRAGVALSPEFQQYFAETNCGNVRGSEIVALAPNKMQLSASLDPLNDVSNGKLPHEKLGRLPRNVLEMENLNYQFKQPHLEFSDTLTFEEPVELRYCKPRC
jgi:hypothetical protein